MELGTGRLGQKSERPFCLKQGILNHKEASKYERRWAGGTIQRENLDGNVCKPRNITSEVGGEGKIFFFFVNIFYQWSNVYSKNKKGCKKGEVGGQKKEKYCSELEQE